MSANPLVFPQHVAIVWAQAHAGHSYDPIKFGADVGLVYRACLASASTDDSDSLTAVLAAMAVPLEVWQSLAQIASHVRPVSEPHKAAAPAGVEAST